MDSPARDWAISLHYFPDEKDIIDQINSTKDGKVKQSNSHGFIMYLPYFVPADRSPTNHRLPLHLIRTAPDHDDYSAQMTNDSATGLAKDERVDTVEPYNW